MNVKKMLCIITIIGLAAVLMSAPKVYAAATKIQILPATNTYYLNDVPPGSTITLNITIQNVTDMMTWQVGIGWNSSILNFSDIVWPTSGNGFVFAEEPHYTVGPDITTPGYAVFGVICNTAGGGHTFNGSGTLAQLKLEVLALTSFPVGCEFTFENIGRDTFLLDSGGLDISFDVETATFTYDFLPRVTHTVTFHDTDYILETYSNESIAQNSIIVNETAKMILFNVTSYFGEAAFVNVTIPKAFLNASLTDWKVYLNGIEITTFEVAENATHTFVYAAFHTSINTVGVEGTWIVPEMSVAWLPMLLAASSMAILLRKKIKVKKE